MKKIRCQGTTDLQSTNVAGTLFVGGAFLVLGFKGAAVPHPDGTHRALYCMESPESWFEDFGRARVVSGKANVELDPTFAAVVRNDDYHVFLSPEGESKGLYVSNRTPAGFEVREQAVPAPCCSATEWLLKEKICRQTDSKKSSCPKLPKFPLIRRTKYQSPQSARICQELSSGINEGCPTYPFIWDMWDCSR